MADLFSVTAPLLIRYPNGESEVMVQSFRHPRGLVFFRIFWGQSSEHDGIKCIEGEISGEGPWKIGDVVITLLGCQGTHPQAAADFSDWKLQLEQSGESYPSREALKEIACEAGFSPLE